MKPFKFNITVLMLITSIASFAQTKQVYSKSFETDLNTTAIFNLENTTVAIEESKDNMMHFDYKIEFSNYTKKEIQSFLDNIKVEAVMYQNHITLTANSASKVLSESFEVDSPFGLTLDSNFFKTDSLNHKISKKSKDSIIKLINNETFNNAFLKNLKLIDDDKKERSIDLSKAKMYKSQFIIKLPKSLKLNINAVESQITLRDNIANDLTVDLKNGFFKSKTLSNENNKVKIRNADFKAISLVGGNYDFINVSNGLIGMVNQVIINSELSKIEIGEIQKNVTITDFNGEFWFYNWTTDFERFDLYSQYSKIHYFYPETDYSLKVIGNNTVNYLGETKIVMQPTKNGEKFNMMERKVRGEGVFSGAINFDIVDGIIYSYDDSFIKNKN